MLRIVSRRSLARLAGGIERSRWLIWLATAGIVLWSIVLPALRIYSIAADPTELGQAVAASVAFACYLPLQLWLVASAARGRRGRPQYIALAAMAAVIFAAMPLIGIGWIGINIVLAALTLVTIPRPWSFVLFGAFLIVPIPLTFAFGRPDWALYFAMGLLLFAVPLAVGISLVDSARELEDARRELARQAVRRERLRIDSELGQTVGAGLESIAAQGDRAITLLTEPAAAGRELKSLVGTARRTLSGARLTVRRYREVSLRSELETAVALLEAAGVTTTLDIADEELTTSVAEGDRVSLRRDVTRLIGAGIATRVTIVIENGTLRLRQLVVAP